MLNSKKYMLGIGVLATVLHVQANEYPINLDSVYQSALSVSNEYKALQKEAESAQNLINLERRYYLPKVSLTGEWYQYYGTETPSPDVTDTLALNINMKLWGSGVSNKIAAVNGNLRASQLTLIGEELAVYYTVLRYLAKIERTRRYLLDNESIERRLKVYLDKQRTASREGASALSSFKEAELEFSRFRDSISRVNSSIDQMFRNLREEVNYQTNRPEDVGISSLILDKLLAQDITSLTMLDITQTNIELRRRYLLLESQLDTVKSQRERLSISLANETRFEVLGIDDLDSGDIQNDSYIGLEVTYDLFNYQNSQTQKSVYHLYDAESERVELFQIQLASQLNSLQQEFIDTKDKRLSLIEQISLNEDLVSTQESELLIDKLEYVDIVQSLASLSASYSELLSYDLSLIDAVVDTMSLRSDGFLIDE